MNHIPKLELRSDVLCNERTVIDVDAFREVGLRVEVVNGAWSTGFARSKESTVITSGLCDRVGHTARE